MKKLITLAAGLALLAGCHSSQPTTTAGGPVAAGNATGAADALSAVRGFMDAAKQQDLQAMGAIFGDKDGPARDRIDREELEKRELIMMCYLRHDRFDVIGDAPAPSGGRALVVNIMSGPLTRSTTFDVVRGPRNRWYVEKFDINALQDLCSRRS